MKDLVEPESKRIYDPKSFNRRHRIKVDDTVVAELKAYGEVKGFEPWNAYESFDLSDDKARQLAAIVEMDGDSNYSSDDDESLPWVPLHAWRILLTKRCEPAIPSLIGRVTVDDEDDWAKDEIPRGLRSFGPIVIDHIINEFKEKIVFGQEAYGYAALIETLTGIAEDHPSEINRIAAFIRDLLSDFEILPPTFNSFVICGAIDLEDIEAAPLIQKIFERRFLDEQIVDWEWVKQKLDLNSLPDKIVHEKPKGNDFHYSGDEKFQKLLKSIGSTFNVDEVKCLLLGSFLAVDMVQPSTIAGQITEDAEHEDGGLETEGQAMYFYREFFGLWNLLAKYQDEHFPLAIGSTERKCDDISEPVLNALKIYWTKCRLIAFNQGLAMGNTDGERFAGTAIGDFIEYIEARIDQFDKLEEDGKSYSNEVVDTQLREVESFWSDNYLAFAKAVRDFRRSEIERQRFVEENKHLGRNEPCPCGSGKKFKKCCMMVH